MDRAQQQAVASSLMCKRVFHTAGHITPWALEHINMFADHDPSP